VPSFKTPHGGLVIWLKINDDLQLNATVIGKLLTEKVRIIPASLFTESEEDVNTIRLGFASLNPKELSLGVGRLKAVSDSE